MHYPRIAAALSLIVLGLSGLARSQTFDPRDYRAKLDGDPTQVMVLGTAHLSRTPNDWDAEVLEPLLERLAAFAPDVIAIENQPGPTLHKLWAYREVYPEAAATFGGRALRMATEAGVSLEMDMPQAMAAAKKRLSNWPSDPSPADRRHLAATFAAAGEPYSALVQWWRLPEAERVAEDGVSRRLASHLNELGREREEGVSLAARLAVRLDLDRLWQVDSQDEDVFTHDEAELFFESVFPAIGERFDADPVLQELGSTARMTDPVATLAEYRKLNSDRINLRSAEVEWLGAIDHPTERDVGRKRMAGWEVRNMRMAANIREASARAPGGRLLVIVGAAHKVWLEAYLGMMSDVEIVPTDELLE
ncbi:DUF5694 domain-containing protein [Parvularcula dongshanensis]|uniref:TraB/GumN family protein n=1 Tax=Parvularcula dongshanensis TaxID=1173995 RepID=A0A840I1Z0_9PROT|nr:DUF5694 domain-containing protein [Parvularcula dongshanensis]MBB4658080.1 hypothetical protein [Parvularcula dongshanensis]